MAGMQPTNGSPGLARQIGFWSAVAVVVGSTIGSGIFRSPAGIAEKVPDPLAMLLVWAVAGLFVLCGALTMAELGGAYPHAGGLYVILREAYGRMAAFLFGWAQLVLIRPAAQGAVALVFAEYALRLKGWTPESTEFNRWATYMAIGAMIVVASANYRGVRLGAGVQNLTTLAKTGGLLVLVALALVMALPEGTGNFSPAPTQTGLTFSAFGLALVSVLWAYDGWADVSYVGGEVVDARRNVPRAILTGTAIIIGVYLLANVAYLAVFSTTEIATSQQVAADVMQRLIGAPGLVFIVATVMISTFGTLNGSLLTAPRIFYAMAEDKLFFRPVARVHPRFRTPHVSIVLTAILSVVFVSIGRFESLTDTFVIALVPFYGLSVGAVFVLRSRQARRSRDGEVGGRLEYDPPVRTPLYPLVPLVFIASTVILLANSLWDATSRLPTQITLAAVLVGAPVYFLTVGRRRGRA